MSSEFWNQQPVASSVVDADILLLLNAGTTSKQFTADVLKAYVQTPLLDNVDADGYDILGIGTIEANQAILNSLTINNSLVFLDGSTQPIASTKNGMDGFISTSVLNQSKSISTNSQVAVSIFFKPDGLVMFILDIAGEQINTYILTTPWDISTAIFSVTTTVADFMVAYGMTFTPDGLTLFIIGDPAGVVHEYTLTTPWVITATLTSVNSKSLDITNPTGIAFKPDGLEMYASGTQGTGEIVQYHLTSPFDITTINAAGDEILNISGIEEDPRDVTFRTDGTRMYVVGNQNDSAYEFALSTPWDITTAILIETFVIMGVSASTGLFFKPDNTSYFLVDESGDQVLQYDLGLVSPGDIIAGNDLSVANLTTLGNTFMGDGDTVLLFDIARAWGFRQKSSGSNTALELYANSSDKNFFITDVNNQIITQFRAGSVSNLPEVYMVPDGGLVSVGTITPDSTFTVSEDSILNDETVGLTIEQRNVAGDALLHYVQSGVNLWTLGTDSSDDNNYKISLGLFDSGTTFMSLDILSSTSTILGLITNNAIVENDLAVANLTILGNTFMGDGSTILLFEIAEAWRFRQKGSDASTALELHSNSSDKDFFITDVNNQIITQFHAGSVSNLPAVYLVPDGGNVGIGTATPVTTLDINGSIGITPTSVTTATYSLLDTDAILAVDTTAAVTVTLPAPNVANSRLVTIKDITGNAQAMRITIDTDGAQTIDGAVSIEIVANYGAVRLFSNGSNWFTG